MKMTKICIPLSEKDPSTLLEKIAIAKKSGAEVLEIWLGEIALFLQNDPHLLGKIVKTAGGIPLLANCKNAKEKGNFSGTETEKKEILLSASHAGFSFVDFDFEISDEILNTFFEQKKKETQLILSAHFWEGTPAIHGLLRISEEMRSKKADILKFATTPRDFHDVITALRFAEKLKAKKIPHIIIAMGELGKITRFFAPTLGNVMTFAALNENAKTAPGQVSVEKLGKFWKEN